MRKKVLCSVGAVLLILGISGCAAKTIDEMYALPRMSERNSNLRASIENSMEGRGYAAPLSGSNQESVQTADLNGDGKEEYLIFTKSTQGEELQILVFGQLEDGHYGLLETIDCKGSSFEQVQYASVDDSPGSELIVGTQLNEKVTRTVSIYSFASGQAEKIKSMVYERLLVCDLNGDGRSELMVIQNGDSEFSNAAVRLYSFSDGHMSSSAEARLSVPPEYIRRMTLSRLSGGKPAVYVSSAFIDNTVVTDILSLRDGVFTNISHMGDLEITMRPVHNCMVYAEDLDGDGVLELPSLMAMTYNTTEQNLIRWFAVDADAGAETRLYTFHNFDDGWYIRINESWVDRIAVEKNGSTYTFYMWNNNYGSAVPVFTIFAFTGKDRDSQAAVQNRFALHRGEDVVFSAKLESGSAIYGVTENYLQSNFHLIRQGWRATES